MQQWGKPEEGKQPQAQTFTAFSDPSIGGKWVSFIGSGNQGTLGLYRKNLASGKLECVADTMTPIPVRPKDVNVNSA